MPGPDPLRSVLLRAAADVLLAVGERAPGEAPGPVTVSDGAWKVRVEVSREQQQETAAPQAGNHQLHLTPLDRKILDRAGPRPLTMAALARRCEHEPDSYFQGRVRRLVGAGRLLRDFDGYRLPERN